MNPGTRRYPFEPLLEIVMARGLSRTAAGEALGMSGKSASDAARNGLLVKAADRCATRAGLHPAEVWSSWWDDALEDLGKPCRECGELFIPAKSNNRFCQMSCNRRWWRRETQRRRRLRPEVQEQNRVQRRAYYAENAEYERRREQRAYQANREAILARRKRRWATDAEFRERENERRRQRKRAA